MWISRACSLQVPSSGARDLVLTAQGTVLSALGWAGSGLRNRSHGLRGPAASALATTSSSLCCLYGFLVLFFAALLCTWDLSSPARDRTHASRRGPLGKSLLSPRL